MEWKTLLASITGTVDQDLLWRNEYRVAENRIVRNQITGRVRLNDGERTTLGRPPHTARETGPGGSGGGGQP